MRPPRFPLPRFHLLGAHAYARKLRKVPLTDVHKHCSSLLQCVRAYRYCSIILLLTFLELHPSCNPCIKARALPGASSCPLVLFRIYPKSEVGVPLLVFLLFAIKRVR